MRVRPALSVLVAVMTVGCLLAACGQATPAAERTSGPGPRDAYACRYNVVSDAYDGAFATASAIGWEGNHRGVVTCLGGSFYVQDGIDADYGFHPL